jgi:hypothetical protein
MWVSSLLKYIDLSRYPLNITSVLDLLFLQDLNSYRFVSYSMRPQTHLSECPLPERFP